MDDILIASPDESQGIACLQHLLETLEASHLKIAPNKIQFSEPYTYLSYSLQAHRIFTPKIELHISSLKMLHDFQKLLGTYSF